MQDIEVAVGKRIKAIRARKKITQEDLADRAGLNRTHLYRIESGIQSMTLHTLKIIADALGVRIGEIFRGI